MIKANKPELPIKLFKNQSAWAKWLDKNHADSGGLWLKIAKKERKLKSASYSEALEIALCYGWIDGQRKSNDNDTFLQKFTPRRKRSIWSKINREKAEEYIIAGMMKPAGISAVENAKKNGQWEAAYESQSKISVPEDLAVELDKSPKAKAFFETLNSVNRYAILFRIHRAKKSETRTKKIKQFIEMLENHEKLYP